MVFRGAMAESFYLYPFPLPLALLSKSGYVNLIDIWSDLTGRQIDKAASNKTRIALSRR